MLLLLEKLEWLRQILGRLALSAEGEFAMLNGMHEWVELRLR